MERSGIGPNVYKRALEIAWLAVIFLIPLFYNPAGYRVFVLNKASLLVFLVGIILALWVADWVINQARPRKLNWRNVFRLPLHLSILVFGLIAVLSTAASITPAISFWGSYFRKAGLLTLICWILFFLIVAQQIRNRAQLLRAVYTLLLSSGIVSLLGILEHFFPGVMLKVFQNPYIFGSRISSTIGNPLFLSSFLAMVIPFNLALIAYSWSKKKDGENVRILIGSVFLLALQLWCLWLAQYSITVLLYIIAPVMFILLLAIVKRKRILLGIASACLIGLAIIAGSLLLSLVPPSPGVETARPEALKPVPVTERFRFRPLEERIQYWQSAIDIVLKSPEVPFSNDRLHFLRKLLGYGPETFTITLQLFFPEKLKNSYTHTSLLIDRPHNDYLYMATTIGLLGLMSFLSILAVFFYLCFRYLRRAAAYIDKLVLIAMVAGMTQYMADIFFNLSTISPELVFWLILALTCAVGRFISNKEPSRVVLEEAARPKPGASYVTRARLLVSLGCAAALIFVGTSVAIRPFLADIYFNKALKLQSANNAQAIYAFDTATKLEPEEATYWHSMADYTFSVARQIRQEPYKSKVLSLSTSTYNQALELNRYTAFEYYSLADVYTYWAEIGATDRWPTALSLYDKASQLFPSNAVILNKWSLALIIKGDFSEAQTKLDYAASLDPDWAETSFLYGLLLAKQGENDEATLKIINPIHEVPYNLNYFIDLYNRLMVYDMVSPLRDTMAIYADKMPDDWIAHALLGITGFFDGDADKSLDEFNSSMLLVPDNNSGDLFLAVLKLSTMNPQFNNALTGVAAQWRGKLSQSPQRDMLLPSLDQLTGTSQ